MKGLKKIREFVKENWKIIVTVIIAVVVGVLTGGIGFVAALGKIGSAIVAGAAGGFAAGFSGTLLNGGSIGDAFKAGVIGGITGAIGGGIAGSSLHILAKVAAHGVTSGAASELQGGEFQNGFVSGAASGFVASLDGLDTAFKKATAGAVVGGTVSEINGGKFSNGAATGAMVALVAHKTQSAISKKHKGSFDSVADKKSKDALANSKDAYNRTDGGKFAKYGISYNDNIDGFGAALYGDEASGFQVAFRGTNGPGDWKANILQSFGFRTSQYEQAVALAIEVKAVLGDNVTFVGHSLGGGLAAAAAGATGLNAITFNAAGVSSTYLGTPGNITAHYIRGEILSLAQDFSPLPSAPGNRISYSGNGNPYERHSRDQF